MLGTRAKSGSMTNQVLVSAIDGPFPALSITAQAGIVVKGVNMVSQATKARSDHLRGCRLETGDGCPVDLVFAAYFYRRAALRGLAEAQHALGFLYATGQGVTLNETMAVHWFEAAARQGQVSAQHNLGVMYAEGRGVSRNEEIAIRWFYQAALGGSAEAREWLARCEPSQAIGE